LIAGELIMAIHPIEYRYGTPEMKQVWSEESKLEKILKVEAALAKAEAEVGMIPADAADMIASATGSVKQKRVSEIEEEINHDLMAVVMALTEQCGDAGKWVHFGATSNDILDTQLGLQIKDSIDLLRSKTIAVRNVLVNRADEHKHTVCVGRTHGQIGVPTTYGLRFAIWASEMDRHLRRLDELKVRAVVGQMTGAVGTQAAFGDNGIMIQQLTMKFLGLGSVEVSNQIIQRDRHAEFVMWMANTATTLDKICVALRSLQRSEIAEIEESFASKQVGSSTMPHKRNPIKSEQVCGLARIVRSMVEPELLNNTLWDERDLTNSSCERIVFPEVCILTDHILKLTESIILNLRFYPENIKKNLNMMQGLNMGEAVMIELAKRGVGRQQAHEIIRTCAMESRETQRHLKDVLISRPEVIQHLNPDEIEQIMDPEQYIGTAVIQVEQVVRRLK
jgi:adenylosuccinate lyase